MSRRQVQGAAAGRAQDLRRAPVPAHPGGRPVELFSRIESNRRELRGIFTLVMGCPAQRGCSSETVSENLPSDARGEVVHVGRDKVPTRARLQLDVGDRHRQPEIRPQVSQRLMLRQLGSSGER